MAEDSAPELRLTDVERDEVVSQLSLAMSEGRLDVAEFEERSRTVYASRVPSDLDGVLEGLPVTAAPAVRSDMTVANTGSTRRFISLIGDRVHEGAMELGDKATSFCLIGDSTFDLTQVDAANVDLRIYSLLGDVTIKVRPGTSVDANVLVLIGDRSDNSPPASQASTMNLRLRIVSLISDVKVTVVE